MAILDEVLLEEYERLKRIQAAVQRELDCLPKEYISAKTIRGRKYYYLQKREGKKIVSTFIPTGDLPDLQKQVARRKQLQATMKELNANLSKLEKVVQ